MFSWVDGTYSYGLYDHHYTPNATTLDCITVNNSLSQGWKAARSRHPGGANVVFGDGSVHFAKSSIDPSTWAAAGTRGGRGERLPVLTQPDPNRIEPVPLADGERSWTTPSSPPTSAGHIRTTGPIPRSAGWWPGC